MDYKDWTTLKTANKVAFKKIAAVAEVKDSDDNITTTSKDAYTVLEKKVYNPSTGAESTVESRIDLGDLESHKARLTRDKAKITAELTEVGKMITAIKKV
tara:strand:- start:1339 stop:1638 length:300 start_codon:yes stop_codon:yes gene_type:complete